MPDDYKEHYDQDDQDGGANHKIQGIAAEPDTTFGHRFSDLLALNFEALLFALNAFFALLLRALHAATLGSGTGAEMLHAATHLAIVVFRLLIPGIVLDWGLFWRGRFRAGDGRTPNRGPGAFGSAARLAASRCSTR